MAPPRLTRPDLKRPNPAPPGPTRSHPATYRSTPPRPTPPAQLTARLLSLANGPCYTWPVTYYLYYLFIYLQTQRVLWYNRPMQLVTYNTASNNIQLDYHTSIRNKTSWLSSCIPWWPPQLPPPPPPPPHHPPPPPPLPPPTTPSLPPSHPTHTPHPPPPPPPHHWAITER